MDVAQTQQSLDQAPGRAPIATLPDAAWGPLAVGSLLLAVGPPGRPPAPPRPREATGRPIP